MPSFSNILCHCFSFFQTVAHMNHRKRKSGGKYKNKIKNKMTRFWCADEIVETTFKRFYGYKIALQTRRFKNGNQTKDSLHVNGKPESTAKKFRCRGLAFPSVEPWPSSNFYRCHLARDTQNNLQIRDTKALIQKKKLLSLPTNSIKTALN